MLYKFLLAFFIFLSSFWLWERPLVEDANKLTVSYIGNMGVLIASKDHTVVIDAFHKEYKPHYSYPSESTVQEIINGNYKNFSKAEIALVTHYHKDHFDPGYYQFFLRENPNSFIAASKQVIDLIGENLRHGLETNLKQIPYIEQEHTLSLNNIEIQAFKCPHTYASRHSSVQNLAFLITMDNYKVLHIGDTDWEMAEPVFRKQKLKEQSIDIAILPYWMLLNNDSIEKVAHLLDPKQIIATHIPPDFPEKSVTELQKLHTNIRLFIKLNEQLKYD